MAGDVKTEQLLFVREQFVLRPFRQLLIASGIGGAFSSSAPKSELCPFCLSDKMLAAQESVRSICANSVARVWPKRSRARVFDQCFQRFSRQGAPVHALAKLGKRLEFSALAARFENRLDHAASPTPLISGHARNLQISFAISARAPKYTPLSVHVRLQHLDAHFRRASAMYSLQFFRVRPCRWSSWRSKIPRDNSPSDTRCLTPHECKRRSTLRLIEAVAGEFFEQVEKSGLPWLWECCFSRGSATTSALLLHFPRSSFCPCTAPQQIQALPSE